MSLRAMAQNVHIPPSEHCGPGWTALRVHYMSLIKRDASDARLSNSTENGDYTAIMKAISFLETYRNPDPFVLFIASRGAHPPYGPPKDFVDARFTIEDVERNIKLRPRGVRGKPKYHSMKNGIPSYREISHFTEDDFYGIHKAYLEMVSYTDHLFGLLINYIGKSRFVNTTCIFISSDHGDFAGDFGLVEKWPGDKHVYDFEIQH